MKRFIITEVVAVALMILGYLMAVLDFFGALFGNYMPKCAEGFVCIQVIRPLSVVYGKVLFIVGAFVFILFLVRFLIKKIKHD